MPKVTTRNPKKLLESLWRNSTFKQKVALLKARRCYF